MVEAVEAGEVAFVAYATFEEAVLVVVPFELWLASAVVASAFEVAVVVAAVVVVVVVFVVVVSYVVGVHLGTSYEFVVLVDL